MKGFIAFLVFALLVINVINFWQIQQLQHQVAGLQARVHKSEETNAFTSDVMNRALPLLNGAREAIQNADYAKARKMLAEATQKADTMSKAVGEKSGPALVWLKQQATSLEEQMNRK